MLNVEFGGKKENKANDRQLLVYIGLYYIGLYCVLKYILRYYTQSGGIQGDCIT